MDESKYGKYIITEVKTDIFLVPGEKMDEDDDSTVANLDGSVIKGAFIVEAGWLKPSEFAGLEPVPAHNHDFDEYLCQFGTDPNNPHDLGGEIEIYLGGEKHIIDKSCIIYIPKGLVHGPIRFIKVNRPIFFVSCGNTKRYKAKN
jgi:hypothetical protein